jgi:hypothetical protein
MTIRLSISSLAGMDRTLVAVGTVRLAVMLTAVRAAAPRSRIPVAPPGTWGWVAGGEPGGPSPRASLPGWPPAPAG